MLAGFVGYQVITRVPPLLHTPLMSATNAISGISLVGSLVAAGAEPRHASAPSSASSRSSAATINVVGGFLITDRMLKMFKREPTKPATRRSRAADASARRCFIQATYLAASVLFILGLKSLTKPDSARRGMQLAAVGMLLAIVGTLVNHEIVATTGSSAGSCIGTVDRLSRSACACR